MRVNLGCADRYAVGWRNVDHVACPYHVDEVVDLTEPLPWATRSITHVYAGHVLEHLTMADAEQLLKRLHPCMSEGGRIMVVGPDVDRARAMIKNGTFDDRYHSLETIIHGDHRWPGTEHRWECTAERVMSLLYAAGWSDVRSVGIADVADSWPVVDRSQLWQCAVTAVVRRTYVETRSL